MKGKVILVTGGESGIGAATVRLAAERGYSVAIGCHPGRMAQGKHIAGELAAGGTRATALEVDLREPESIVSMFAALDAEFGTLHALVNSAGVDMQPTLVQNLGHDQIAGILQVNVVAVMLCCREAVGRMSAGGAIVNVSSMAATNGGRPGMAAYAASKAAVDAFTLGLAKEVAIDGIRVVSIRPGVVRTEMTERRFADPAFSASVSASIPLGRPAKPQEVAGPILFALSGEASFMTGCAIDVSGGGFSIASAGRAR